MSKTALISLDQLQPGIVLPCEIFDGKTPDLLLLGRGVRLTRQNLNRLVERGITSVAIDKQFANQLNSSAKRVRMHQQEQQNQQLREQQKELKPLIQDRKLAPTKRYDKKVAEKMAQKREKKGEALQKFFKGAGRGVPKNGKQIRGVTVDAIEDLMSDMDLFVKLAIDPSDDQDDHGHCVRVSELAMAIAAVMEFPRNKIEELGIGCLIYRAAISQTARTIRAQKRKLTQNEKLELTKIPRKMYDAMEDVKDLPPGARQVAYQIYERWNGSGYPRNRAGNQIHPLARVAAVADVYVALTSERPYRPAYDSYQAVEIILKDTRKRLFEPNVVKALLQTICLFPIGSYVELSDRRIAQVLRTNLEQYDRPIVEVLFSKQGLRIENEMIDLSKEKSISIAKPFLRDIAEGMLMASETNAKPQPVEQIVMV